LTQTIVQIRVDAVDGPVIGTTTMLSAGGFDTYRTHSIPIAMTKGVHDVYLVAASEGPRHRQLDCFSFAAPALRRSPVADGTTCRHLPSDASGRRRRELSQGVL
jgi:hypothetical protein